jgi:hypothetical protein
MATLRETMKGGQPEVDCAGGNLAPGPVELGFGFARQAEAIFDVVLKSQAEPFQFGARWLLQVLERCPWSSHAGNRVGFHARPKPVGRRTRPVELARTGQQCFGRPCGVDTRQCHHQLVTSVDSI